MKKWLVAFALCLTLCLCMCAALADDHLTITVSNAEIQNGAVSGAYYYKLYADTNLNSFLMGWGVDVSAAEPEEGEWYPTSLDYWYQDDNGYFIVTTPPSSGDYSADVMFYRIGEDDPWQKIVFNYDLSLTATAEVTGMTAEGPSMFEEDFTLEWDAVEGADAYVVYVKRPDFGEQPARYMTPGNSLTIKAPAYGEEQNRLWPVGEYECSVVAMANQQLVSFTNAAAYTVSPVLGLSPWNEDFVVPNGDGSGASIKLNQWMQLAATAPGANLVRVHQLDTGEEELNDDNIFEVVWPGDYGAGEFSWIGVGQPQGFSKILVAEAEMPDGATYLSSPFTIQVGYDGEIEEDVVYTVSHTDNVYDEETGRFIVARDGMLYVDVENMDVNFFGLYIGQWENGNWLADSHWINLSDGQTTRVPLTVPRCQAGQDYEVHVCAVRFGCPQKDAEITIPIHVTEAATDCDIIVTMEREYIVGQSLRVFAHYTNPDDIDGLMQIRIREKGSEDNIVYAEMGDFYDYWDNDAVIWQSGTFVVDARIMQFGENGAFVREDHPEIWEFTVNANGQVAAPHVNAFSTFPAGQDLILNLYAEASEDEEMPDWFEASLFRVDGDGFIGSAMTEDIVDGQGTIMISKDRFEAGGLYWIRLFGMKYGCEVGVTEFRFLVTGETAMEQDLILTVNGSFDEDQEALSSAELSVKVAYEGKRPAAIRILNGDHWEYWRGDDRFTWDWGFGDDEILIYAEGTDDEIDFEALMENDWENFDWNRDVNWTRKSNLIRLNVYSPYGKMSAPECSIENPEMGEGGSGVIPWGDSVSLLIADAAPMVLDPEGGEAQPVENGWFFCNLYVQRWNENGDSWWDRIDQEYHYDVHSGLNSIYTYNLEGGCRYQLEIGADGEGYSGRSSRMEFELGEKPEDPEEPLKVFTVNHETANLTVQTYEEMQLAAYQSDAEWYGVEIYREDDEGWYEDRNNNWNGMLMDSWRANEAGSYTLEAYAYGHIRDEQGNITQNENGDDEWRELIGTVHVTASAVHGDLAPAIASISAEKNYVGDEVVLTFSGPNSAENFNYWVHPVWDGRWVAGNGRNRAGVTSFSTDMLESGVYCVEVDAQALGYNQSHETLYFVLLDENDADFSNENRIFTISATEVTTETDVRIIAYLPGADAVEVYFSKDGGELEEFRYENGPGLSTWFSRGDAGSYDIYVSGEYDGEWSEPERVCTLEITAEYEFASAPVVTVNGSAQGAAAPTDENDPHRLNVSIQRDEEAQGYHLMIREYGDRWMLFDWFVDLNAEENGTPFEISGDTVSVSIRDERIEPGRVYTLECSAHAQNYECSGTSRTFVLQREGQQSVTLEVTPINDEGFWTGREVHVTASAPDATAIHIRMNNEDRWYRGDTMNERWNIWDMGTMFYAYATTDPIPEDDGFLWSELNVDWSMQSEPIWIEADTLGDTEIPSLAFDNQVAKGEWLEITIGDDADVRQIDVRISNDNGDTFEFRRLWSPGVYKLSTANLEAGQRYWVWLSCVQDKHLWTNGEGLALYVDEPEDDTAFFRTDKTTLYPGERFIPTVYAPGALHIWIEETSAGGLWGDWNGENATNDADWEWWYDDPGEFSLTAWAQYPDQEERTRIGDVVFTVLEPAPLDAPEISAPLEADVTQDIQISVAPVEYGYDYYLQLHYFDQENEWIGWGKTVKDVDQESGQLIWTVPVGTLEANKPYWIDVYAAPARDDYAHAESSASICIMTVDGEARDAGITLAVVPGSNVTATDEGFSVPVNTDFGVTVSASGNTLPTAIAVYMGDRTAYRFFNDADGSAETEYVTMSEYQPWPEMIFARACYDDLSGYDGWDDVPWSELNWGSVSNAVQVNFTANGPAEPPVINCPWATVAGRDMVVTVTLGANANEAHANIDRILGGWQQDLVFDRWIPWEPTEGSENQGTITIPTDGLAVGAYRLYVDNSGEGYDNSRATEWFHIAEDPYESTSKLVLPAGLKTIEDEAFEGIAAETVIIPEGVTTIGKGAFRNSSVRLVVIPASVTFIGEDAFADTNLSMVYGFNDGPALQLVHDTDAAAFCFIGE